MLNLMKNTRPNLIQPEAINMEEFMEAVMACTPRIMRSIKGIVNVDVTITIDEAGRVASFDTIQCRSIRGHAVSAEEPEIVEAARAAVNVLRFRPARREGIPVRHSGFQFIFGFTTAALDFVEELRTSSSRLN